MGKKRKRIKRSAKVYNTPRPRSKALPKEPTINEQYKGVVQHSIEVLKLKIEQSLIRKIIAMVARNRDNMSHFIGDYKQHLGWFEGKIQEHIKASKIKMELFMGELTEVYEIPDNFHMTSADLKSGYVVLEKKEDKSLVAVIMSDINPDFPHDNIKLGSVIPFNEDESIEILKHTESLLKEKDVFSAILSRNASEIENIHADQLKLAKKWLCVSATCTDRKSKIDIKDI